MADARRTRGHFDLWLAGVTMCAAAVLALAETGGPFRWALSVPALTIAPGHAFVSALFPRRHPAAAGSASADTWLDHRERFALAVAMSLTGLPIWAFIQTAMAWRLTLASAVLGIAAPTLVLLVIAGLRRARVPRAERYAPPLPRRIEAGRGFQALVAVSFLMGLAVLAAAFSSGPQVQTFTELYLLGPQGEAPTGPVQVQAGEALAFAGVVVNQQGRAVTYELTVTLERHAASAGARPTQGSAPMETLEVLRTTVPLATGQTADVPIELEVPAEGVWRLMVSLGSAQVALPEHDVWVWIDARAA